MPEEREYTRFERSYNFAERKKLGLIVPIALGVAIGAASYIAHSNPNRDNNSAEQRTVKTESRHAYETNASTLRPLTKKQN